MKFSSFDALTKPNKLKSLMHIKESKSRRREEYFLALHAMTDADQEVRLTAKLATSGFSGESYFQNLKGVSVDDLKKLIQEKFQEAEVSPPFLVKYAGKTLLPKMSQDLQGKTKKAELSSEWEGPFPKSAALLNTLREDTREMIQALIQSGESVERAFLGCYQEPFKPFRELLRSLDSNTSVTVINLHHALADLNESTVLSEMLALVSRPIYLLAFYTNRRFILFLRDEMKESRAAVLAVPFQSIKNVLLSKGRVGALLEIETHQAIFKIPRFLEADAAEIEKILRDRCIEAIQADEQFIERDFERELSKLEMLFKGKAIIPSEYAFRKNRLKKMEFEKFSETNLEAMLAKRFSDVEFGRKVDSEILKRFTHEKTIMFTDMVGFSKKAAEKQLIDTMTLLAVHDKMLLPTITKYQGQLIKKIGDALMIKFDSPIDACTAAKEMQRALILFNRSSSEKILIRIGINTGKVFVKNQDVFGDAVNVASRMESMAMPGKIFLTETTYGMLQGAFSCLDCGEHEVKGQQKPILIYALIDETGEDREMIAYAKELGAELTGVPEVSDPPETAAVAAVAPVIPSASLPTGRSIPDAANSSSPEMGGKGDSEAEAPVQPAEVINTLPFDAVKNAVQTAIERYRVAVKAGTPRHPDLERWFTYYVEKLKPQL